MIKLSRAMDRAKKKILVLSYAFPPIAVQMTAITMKGSLAIKIAGYQVDAVYIDYEGNRLPKSVEFEPIIKNIFTNLIPIKNNKKYFNLQKFNYGLFGAQDEMEKFNGLFSRSLKKINFQDYDAIVTWSPFHSINMVAKKIKNKYKNIQWLAHFSDPWAHNPLEKNFLSKFRSSIQEPSVFMEVDKIFLNSQNLDIKLTKRYGSWLGQKISLLPHPYVSEWYPQRPKKINKFIVIRFIGTLFGRRSAEPFFYALQQLLVQESALKEKIKVEIIGSVPEEMLQSDSAKFLQNSCMSIQTPISYIKSLEYIYDADILILIEADINNNLFVPSKLSDYIGSNNPILGIVPLGWTHDIISQYGGWVANPSSTEEITKALKSIINIVTSQGRNWNGSNDIKDYFSINSASIKYKSIIEELSLKRSSEAK